MKKLAFFVFIFAGVSITGFSQERNEVQPERIKLVPVSKESSGETPEQEVARLESQLHALDEKEAWIRSNPEELKKATENGWFENAEKDRKEINARLSQLKK